LDISVCYVEIDEEIKDLFQFDTAVGHNIEHRAPDIKTDDKMKRVYISEVTTMKIKDPEEVHSLLSTIMGRRANNNNLPTNTNQKNQSYFLFQIHITGRNSQTNEYRNGTMNIIELPSSDLISSESTFKKRVSFN